MDTKCISLEELITRYTFYCDQTADGGDSHEENVSVLRCLKMLQGFLEEEAMKANRNIDKQCLDCNAYANERGYGDDGYCNAWGVEMSTDERACHIFQAKEESNVRAD